MNYLNETAAANVEKLKRNPYPGRGIVIGQTPDGLNFVQVYWIMGRSGNSRNRVFEEVNGFVRTRAFDEAKVTDPSLIIYYPLKNTADRHIISNGDQTETIYESFKKGGTFEAALQTREFEPDAPNFTPRISGALDLNHPEYRYKLSLIKTSFNNPEYCERHFFNYRKAIPGIGHCLHTYSGDGDPLPSFAGEPYPVTLGGEPREVAEFYWNLLNYENKVSLLVKFIDSRTGGARLIILNKNLGD